MEENSGRQVKINEKSNQIAIRIKVEGIVIPNDDFELVKYAVGD
jgi:hypothetical protein